MGDNGRVNAAGLPFTSVARARSSARAAVEWLLHLSLLDELPDCPAVSPVVRATLRAWVEPVTFGLEDAEKICKFERECVHETAAVNQWVVSKLKDAGLQPLVNWVHFGLTSEDVQELSLAYSLDEAKAALVDVACEVAAGLKHRDEKQGSEEVDRFVALRGKLVGHRFMVKWGGATGNMNALVEAVPEIGHGWGRIADVFIESQGFTRLGYTTQVSPNDDLVDFLQKVRHLVLAAWGQFPGEAGRQLDYALPVIREFESSLPVSRLQRDLSNSTRMRNIGVVLAACYSVLESVILESYNG